MMKWSRSDVLNAVRDLTRHMSVATLCHLKAMKRVMAYLTATPNRGLTLQPSVQWDGSLEFQFTIAGFSDLDFKKDPATRKSVSGWAVFLNGAPISMRSKMQDCTTLSVTEAELVAATACVQDMLFAMRLMESIGLSVKKPMALTVDNKGAKDLANNWSVEGRTRHIDVRYYFLHELKEAGLVQTVWQHGTNNCADLFTKNLDGAAFRRHAFAVRKQVDCWALEGRVLEAIGREPAGGAARPTSWSWMGHGETQIIVVVIGWMDGEEMWEFFFSKRVF